jgi:hypothetical protein
MTTLRSAAITSGAEPVRTWQASSFMLRQSNVSYLMVSVLGPPMTPLDLLPPLGIGFSGTQTGDGVVGLPAGHSSTGPGPLDATHLTQVRPVQVIIESGGTPQPAFLLTVPASTPLAGHPRAVGRTAGQWLPVSWVDYPSLPRSTHHPDLSGVHYLAAQSSLGIPSIAGYQVALKL